MSNTLSSCNQLIIICGGLGSRLRHVVNDRPKVLAEIKEKPFLSYLLEYFEGYGLKEVILSTGIGAKDVEHFVEQNSNKYSFNLKCCTEDSPLGTGGAVSYVLRSCGIEPSFIVNGDSFWPFKFKDFYSEIPNDFSSLALLALPATNEQRYGSFSVNNHGLIEGFSAHDQSDDNKFNKEKKWINGGMYYASQEIVELLSEERGTFSMEKVFFPKLEKEGKLAAICLNEKHVDIGTVETYSQAQKMALFGEKYRK